MPVAALVGAAGLFGIDENALRVAIARLLSAGQIARDERGQYRLGEAAQAIDQRVLGWRTAELRITRWSGGWWMVRSGTLPPARSRERRAREHALRLLGFAELSPGIASATRQSARFAGGAARRAARARSRGGRAGRARARARSRERGARAPTLEARRRLRSPTGARSRSWPRARRGSGGCPRTRRWSSPSCWAAGSSASWCSTRCCPSRSRRRSERRALVQAMRRYDRAGRRAWASFLARHGAPHVATPAHGERTLALEH